MAKVTKVSNFDPSDLLPPELEVSPIPHQPIFAQRAHEPASPSMQEINPVAISETHKPMSSKTQKLKEVQVRWPENAKDAIRYLAFMRKQTYNEILLKAFIQYAQDFPEGSSDAPESPFKAFIQSVKAEQI